METTILKTLEYSLPALTLSESECRKIMQPILSISLPKTSISRNSPQSVLFGPVSEGGLGLDSLYYTQGAMHLEKFQLHLGTDTMTGKLIQVSLESAQLEIGIGRNLFQLEYKLYGHLLTDCWLKCIWKFAQQNDIIIIDRHTKYPTPQHEHDVFLMEIFIHEGYSKAQLKKINRCRLYLGVLTVSDVMNGRGNGFTSTYNCIKDDTRPTRYLWPKQPKPGAQSIRQWKSALRKSFGLRQGVTAYQLGKLFYNIPQNWR